MAYNFPYLKDTSFLKEFNQIHLKEQYVKLTVLDFQEKPISEIAGLITGGNFNLDGSSAMRRTGNLTMVADEFMYDLTTTRSLISINKKIQVLIGFTNNSNSYADYDIIWFPMGIYVIMNVNINKSSSGLSISLTLHDKMAFLNGECGGTLPASVTFSDVEDINEDGTIIITHPTIYQIIQQLVNHFGGQQLGKIIINDVDSKIKKVMRWRDDVAPLYLLEQKAQDGIGLSFYSTDAEQIEKRREQWGGVGTIRTFNYGEDAGYILADFVYPTQLIGNAGETVVSILDKIKNTLGNYQYFYDINGNFIFQEKKNYLNTTFSTTKLQEIITDTREDEHGNVYPLYGSSYKGDYTRGKSVYEFNDSNIILSYQNTPQYQQIKNDFVVWGVRNSVTGSKIPIRYHLAIDKKPKVGNTYKVFFYTDPDDGIKKAKVPIIVNSYNDLPVPGQVGLYYMTTNNTVYRWDSDKYVEQGDDLRKHYSVVEDAQIKEITTTDYRSELYFAGVANQPYGLASNYYYAQLKNEWPKLYDLDGDPPAFKQELIDEPSNMDFFLDFIDSPYSISEFGVDNIGRRTAIISNNTINCIFEPNNPNIIIINSNGTEDVAVQIENCKKRRLDYCLVDPAIYQELISGGVLRSAYEQIRSELYQYTSYNQQVSLTTLPIYYLEPNVRITIEDSETGISGDYIIKSISLPLDIGGTMNISCTKATERI